MKNIQIKYHRPILGQTTYSVDVPAIWNELTSEQLIRVAGLLFSRQTDPYRIKISLLQILMSFKWHHLQIIGGERLIDLFPFIDFISEEIRLTENKITELKLRGIRFFGPIGDFSTLTGDEWTEADEAYIEFSQTQEESALNRMMAILFRPRQKGMWSGHSQWMNDYRVPYSEGTIKNRIPYMERVPLAVKLAVLLWWKGCRREWEEVFERVFQAKGEGPESFGWQETLLKLSGSEFGDLNSTQRTYMYKLMLKMEITLKDEEYRKEQEEAMKRKSRM